LNTTISLRFSCAILISNQSAFSNCSAPISIKEHHTKLADSDITMASKEVERLTSADSEEAFLAETKTLALLLAKSQALKQVEIINECCKPNLNL